jgi:hypothetical protein
MITIRELREDEVAVTVCAEAEEGTPLDEAFPEDGMGAEDRAATREMKESIAGRLRDGDAWAFCSVRVTARWGEFEASSSLGCCSYEDEADFRRDAYFSDLLAEAVADLSSQAASALDRIRPLLSEGT